MGRAPSRFVASIARRALLLATACLLAIGAAPALADGPLGLAAKVDVGGTVSGATGAVAGVVPPNVGAPAAPATQQAPALAKAAADSLAAVPAAARPGTVVRHVATPRPPSPPTGGRSAGDIADGVAAGAGQASEPVRQTAAPLIEQSGEGSRRVRQHVDRLARQAPPLELEQLPALVQQLPPLVHELPPVLQQLARHLDPLAGGLAHLLAPPERLLRGPAAPAPGAGVVASRGWRLPGLGTADRPPAARDLLPPADGEAVSRAAGARGVDAPAGAAVPQDVPSAARAGSTTLAPREALRPPLSRSVPGGAPAGGGSPGGFFFSPFLALLVLVALAAPTLLRRFELPPAFLRPALLACALERPG